MKRKILRFIQFIFKRFVKHPVTAVLLVLICIYFLATFTVMICEKQDFVDATAMIFPAFLGELGTVESDSIITKISILTALVVSIGSLAVITAKITTMFIEFISRGGTIMKKIRSSGHIIICSWNFQGPRIINELLRSEAQPKREIVILANCEQRPTPDERVSFVRGDPTQDEDLIRAGVKNADSVIVLSDLTKPANEADAAALMIVLAVESLNRSAHTCVQILNNANRIHLERAHADEIICLDQLGANLVVASAVNHGVSNLVGELLTFNKGSEFYRYDKPLSESYVGKEYSEAVQTLATDHILLLGIETDDTEELRKSLPDDVLYSVEDGVRVIVVNPQGQYAIRQGDALFLIAEKEPTQL